MMTILDTNVISEVVRPRPEPRVLAWLAAQPNQDVYLTAITTAEVLYGIYTMPGGKRRTALDEAINLMFRHEFAGRVLPFDEAAGLRYARLVADLERAGRPMSAFDAQIAAIAGVHDAVVATRNVSHFAAAGVRLVNPWTEESVPNPLAPATRP